MPVRIYSLAKELKLDSKVLVDICTAAGVTGKGSALASLTDEEVDQVKAHMARQSQGSARSPAAGGSTPPPMHRPAAAPVTSAVPVLPSHAKAHAPAHTPPAAPVVAAPAPAPVEPPAPVSAPDAPIAATAAPATVAAESAGGIRREDYLPPGGSAGKAMPVLGGEKKRRSTSGEGYRPPVQRSSPGIKMAPMPTVQQPVVQAPAEPAPQKPDLRLPADAIRASKSGGKPLSEHLRKHETKKRQETAAPEAPGKGDAAKPGAGRGDRGVRRGGAPAMPAAGVESDAAAASRDRGKRGRGGTAVAAESEQMLGGREQRQLNRKRAGSDTRRRSGDEDDTMVSRPRMRQPRPRRTGTNTAAPRKTKAVLELPCTVRSFSEAVGVPVQQVLRQLVTMGTMATINATIDAEVVELLAVELGVELDLRKEVSFADKQMAAFEEQQDNSEDMETRPPVITFLGHVDHGKTSLLDKIIGIDVASGESGGITQHIRAYEIDKDGRKIAFVDTPGHEAFTEMRARGANVTDIAVLVVAADDGVMPQTEEAISHARAADVPIVVALNKTDLPGWDIQRIYQQLATNNLLPTEWGGDVEVVKTSALTGAGLDDLLETLLTIAELHDYKANARRPAFGTCLEASLHEGRGVVAKILVQSGTLKVGDAIVCGSSFGRVKAIYDTLKTHKTYQEAGPSTPVNITGLDEAPGAGEHFYVFSDVATARQIAEQRKAESRSKSLAGAPAHVTLENLFEHLGREEVQTLNVILRADVRGSIEAILKELTKLEHEEVKIKVLQATVGGITEADVHLADASDAIVIGFNVVPDEGARSLADKKGVQVRRYDIIYKVTEDLKAALEGMLKPEKREMDLGRALVQRTFTISRIGTIAGCRVLGGTVQRNSRVRVIRDNRIIGDYNLESLKREKDDAREVREGLECGIKLGGFNDLKEGDILETYKIEEIARTF